MDYQERKATRETIDDYLARKVSVSIIWSDETGIPVWAVDVNEDETFWLNAFPTRAEAETWCQAKGLGVTRIVGPTRRKP